MTTTIRTLAEVENIERTPIEERVSSHSSYKMLELVCKAHPDNIAITELDETNPLQQKRNSRFSDLLKNVNQMANLFHGRGIQPNEAITPLLPLVAEAFYVQLAAETVAINNPVNPMLEVAHIVGITEAANTRILVIPGQRIDREVFDKAVQVVNANPNIHTVLVLGGGDECDGEKFIALEHAHARQESHAIVGAIKDSPDDVIAYIHTGGTTGTPKLAQHTQRMRVTQAISMRMMLGYSVNDNIIHGLPLFHVIGAIILGIAPLLSGSRLFLISPKGYRDHSAMQSFWEVIDTHKITTFVAVPTVFSMLLNLSTESVALTSLRLVLTGGSAVPTEMLKVMSEKVGFEISQGIGMTEVGGICSFQASPTPKTRGSAGIRLPYVQAKIALLENGTAVGEAPTGDIGMLCFKGPSITPGYAGGRAHKETFTEDGWLITGDLARMDKNGEIWMTGRAKDLIIRGGHNIDPVIIEEVLHRHPAVELAAAVGKPDEYAGELPTAYVQLKPGQHASEQELLDFTKAEIVERAATPSDIIILDEIPKTAIGKVFKPALRKDAIKRTYESRLHRNAIRIIDARVDVIDDPVVGVLAKVYLRGELCDEQETIVRDILNPFTTRFQIEWLEKSGVS